MSYVVVAVNYESIPTTWLHQNHPSINILAVASFDAETHLLLLTKADAVRLIEDLTRDLYPPFVRRYEASTRSYAPGFVYDLDRRLRSASGMARMRDVYQSLFTKTDNADAQALLGEQIRLANPGSSDNEKADH